MTATPPPRRKGAIRMSEIPPEVRARLDAGLEETVTLVEWLAVHTGRLARALATAASWGRAADDLVAEGDRLAAAPISERARGMGAAVHRALRALPARTRTRAFEVVAGHPSDVVRAWGAYAVGADPDLGLADRLAALRRFAADRSMSTRECAWDSWRPHVAADLERGLRLLRPWVADVDPCIRRCAVEGTRPRGVWTAHVVALKDDPSLGLPLLEPVRSDPSDYVRRAVANWVNDASKSQPAWARALAARWRRESPTPETAWIVRRALRTLRAPEAPRPRRHARRRTPR